MKRQSEQMLPLMSKRRGWWASWRKKLKLMAKMRFIGVTCGLGVFQSPISIDNRVVCIMIKESRPLVPINLHHLSLAALAWLLRTFRSY